jgi:hypothetical protein
MVLAQSGSDLCLARGGSEARLRRLTCFIILPVGARRGGDRRRGREPVGNERRLRVLPRRSGCLVGIEHQADETLAYNRWVSNELEAQVSEWIQTTNSVASDSRRESADRRADNP